MNKIIPFSTVYLSPSRTIEILNLVKFEGINQIYIYNYEGKHFRVFENLIGLIQFFELRIEPPVSFHSELDLDDFLDKPSIREGKREPNL
jgi:hypothetical protein